MNRTHRSRDEGIALLVVTLFIAMGILILGALSMRVVNQSKQVDQYITLRDCFQGLEASFAEAKVSVEYGGDGMIGLGSWTPPTGEEGTITLPTFDDDGISPETMLSNARVEYMAYSQDWSSDGIDNNGDGSTDGLEELGYYTVHCFARNGGVVRQCEVVVGGDDVNVWRNAIFGGTGQAGGLINGNVAIHGSVHLLGDNIPEGGEAVAAIDMSGTSLIHNNYEGLDANLRARIPSLPTCTFDGEVVETLSAKLRVKNGLVSLSGNSEIGEPHQTGNTWKETMDGTFVNDGWTGNAVNDDGGRGDPTSVYSDNGWDMPYDLGDRVELPIFSDDWRDMYTGDRVTDPLTGLPYTHEDYFAQIAGTPYSGDMLIKCNQDFYYNATRPTDPDPANRQPTDDYILFDESTDVMEINGQIQINGDLEMTRGGGNDDTIHYTGRAAILVNGNVTLDTDLLTVNSDGTTADSFPVNNIIGIMAQDSMVVGSAAQLTLMGAFYAQNEICSEKQTITLGTFVSDYFNMGSQVPDIYQVPTLADNLPYGMIGAYPVLIFQQIAWRELGVA